MQGIDHAFPSAKKRKRPTFHHVGIADMAFVVLFFFVITIVPSEETGFLMKMEAWTEEPPSVVVVKSRNILSIGIYLNHELLVRGDTASFETLKNLFPTPTNHLNWPKTLGKQKFT